jgi:hypothetical protein
VYAGDNPVNVVDPSGRDNCFLAISASVGVIGGLIGTLFWIDPIAAGAILALQAIPVVGDLLAILAGVALVAANIWTVEGTVYEAYNVTASACGLPQLQL